jgi:hypothetical protein
MRWLFRPSLLALLSVLLVAGAAAVLLWPRSQEVRAAPLRDDESEIVWLYSATSESSWERFVTAVSRAAKRLQADYPDLAIRIDDKTFPLQTTAHPEVALTVRHGSARLLFRWYKLTSDQKTDQWVAALLNRARRPPLAVIGGSSSEQAKEIALSLKAQVEQRHLATAPLLLLTTATADRVPLGEAPADAPLSELHAGRTFRFCFTNRQMASDVTRFVQWRDELRPDAGPSYVAMWEDDAYSKDLTGHFLNELERPLAGGGQSPLPVSVIIDYSVGGFDQPNRWEAREARRLMEEKLAKAPRQRRPLLVLAAPGSQQTRRFLHGLARTAPVEARRFVVVTGDALSFNTVYRDRNDLWPIQDLPFDLVFFCHRSPVEGPVGFVEDSPSVVHDDTQATGHTPRGTGTEDLLLYMDIVEALAQAVNQGEAMPASGDELGERLRGARWREGRVAFGEEGTPLFDGDGNRTSGTGEHVVWLRPDIVDEPHDGRQEVLPQPIIRVYTWRGAADGGTWQEVRKLHPVDYDDTGGNR